MNDSPITDFDKLKNTLIEIGVEPNIDYYWNEIKLDQGVKFIFRSSGQLKGIEVEYPQEYPDD